MEGQSVMLIRSSHGFLLSSNVFWRRNVINHCDLCLPLSGPGMRMRHQLVAAIATMLVATNSLFFPNTRKPEHGATFKRGRIWKL
jgi:hypothetical protein